MTHKLTTAIVKTPNGYCLYNLLGTVRFIKAECLFVTRIKTLKKIKL